MNLNEMLGNIEVERKSDITKCLCRFQLLECFYKNHEANHKITLCKI